MGLTYRQSGDEEGEGKRMKTRQVEGKKQRLDNGIFNITDYFLTLPSNTGTTHTRHRNSFGPSRDRYVNRLKYNKNFQGHVSASTPEPHPTFTPVAWLPMARAVSSPPPRLELVRNDKGEYTQRPCRQRRRDGEMRKDGHGLAARITAAVPVAITAVTAGFGPSSVRASTVLAPATAHATSLNDPPS
jgi:hypothetical protein